MKRGSLISRRQHEEALANLRRAHQAEVDRLTADNERLRAERNQFKKDRDAHKAAAEAANARLAEPVNAKDLSSNALRRRLRHLEKELDNATFLEAGRPQDSSRWQPANQEPKGGAS